MIGYLARYAAHQQAQYSRLPMRPHRYQPGTYLICVPENLFGRVTLGHLLAMRYQSLMRQLRVYKSEHPLSLEPLLDMSLPLSLRTDPGLIGR
jgi:hypothetical protein